MLVVTFQETKNGDEGEITKEKRMVKELENTIITIQDTHCWRCGREFKNGNKTGHHGIPQALKPKRNVIIPICRECHDETNTIDYTTLLSFMYKIRFNSDDLVQKVQALIPTLENISSTQSKLDEAIKPVQIIEQDICLECKNNLGRHCEEAEVDDTIQTKDGRTLQCEKFKKKNKKTG